MSACQSSGTPWGELDHSLRTGEPAFAKLHPEGVFGYLANHPEESRIFNSAMTSKSHRDIAAILPAYDFSQFAPSPTLPVRRAISFAPSLKTCQKRREFFSISRM